MSQALRYIKQPSVPKTLTTDNFRMTQRHLILGGSGVIGRQLYRRLGKEDAIATYCRNEIVGGRKFCPLRDEVLDFLNDQPQLKFGIILFAETSIESCAADYANAHLLNVIATRNIIDALVASDVIPVFISSDMVFDGTRGGYTETDRQAPIVSYGRMKFEIEQYLQSLTKSHLIVRLSKVVSGSIAIKTEFSNWQAALENQSIIRCAMDQKFSPIDIFDAVEGIVTLLQLGKRGLYNLGGPRALSRAELLEIFIGEAREYQGVIAPQIEYCSIRDFKEFAELRPYDTSLNSDKFNAATGLRLRDISKTCRAFAEAIHSK